MSLLLIATCILTDAAAQDSTIVSTDIKARPRSPHRATMLAAALPGMGQVYNRKYWKIPLVYAGFAGLGYGAWFNASSHVKFTRAYQDFTDVIPETDSYLDVIRGIDPATYDPVLYPDSYNPSDSQWIKEQLLSRVDYYKKYRDLSYIGIAAWYLISILDANVDASLSDYDVGESINISVLPAAMNLPGGQILALNIKLVKSF
ncbi:MAG: hypothetical protein IH591_04905 [Bacteroidales bacterium]|nr:hypothetical protein [Bacteroidales bacterium]